MKVVKKKKKKLGAGRTGGGAPSSGEHSSLRPRYVEKTPPCTDGCPAGNAIRRAIIRLGQGEKFGRSFEESLDLAFYDFTESTPFPAVCGRVCPHPCEGKCNRGGKEGPVSINALERFIGDRALAKGLRLKMEEGAEERDEKISVIGAGPAGLSCAYHLRRKGYKVTVYEGFPKAGGMLRYGIPPYRLPREVLGGEIKRIEDLGVEIKLNRAVGRDVPYSDVVKESAAVFIGLGAHKGSSLRVEGEDAPNVMSGADFLHRINSGEKVDAGKKVIVIGGGDSAIDAARTSLRLGAEVTIVYRRTVKEMPAIPHEIEEAQAEGVKLHFLTAPIGFIKEGERATGMKCRKMELGEPDDSGRRRPVPIEGSEFEIEADTVIAAIGQEPDFGGLEHLRAGPRDWIRADESGKITAGDPQGEIVHAGGDVLDLRIAIDAIAQGRNAADAIHARLKGEEWKKPSRPPAILPEKMRLDKYEELPRREAARLSTAERLGDGSNDAMTLEVSKTLVAEEALAEAKRCMSCGQCFGCDDCWKYCQDNAVLKPQNFGEPYKFKLEFCTGCKKCAEECPCGYIEMT